MEQFTIDYFVVTSPTAEKELLGKMHKSSLMYINLQSNFAEIKYRFHEEKQVHLRRFTTTLLNKNQLSKEYNVIYDEAHPKSILHACAQDAFKWQLPVPYVRLMKPNTLAHLHFMHMVVVWCRETQEVLDVFGSSQAKANAIRKKLMHNSPMGQLAIVNGLLKFF